MQGILPAAWTPQITFHLQAAAAHCTESFKLRTPPYTLSRLSLPAGPVPPGLRPQPPPRRGQGTTTEGLYSNPGWQQAFRYRLLGQAQNHPPEASAAGPQYVNRRPTAAAEPAASSPHPLLPTAPPGGPLHTHAAHARARALRPVGPEVAEGGKG